MNNWFTFLVIEVQTTINGKDGGADGKFYSINYYTLPTKIAYFLNGARVQVDKFFILFLLSVGFNSNEAGMIAGLQSIGCIIGAPAFGFIADKFRIYKLLAVALCVLTIITTCLQPVIGIVWGDRHRFKCPFELNQTSHNNDGFRNSVNHDALFYSFLFIGILARSFDATLTSFVDMGCLRRVETSPKKTSCGRQRWTRSLGMGSGIILYSIALNYYPTSSITSCETGVFVIYSGITVFLGIGTYYLFKGFKKVSDNEANGDITGILKLTFSKFDTIFFSTTVLFSGITRSVYFSFLYLRLKEMNAKPILFGFQALIITISGLVISYFAAKVIKFLGGTMNAICCSLFIWSLRFLCVSLVTTPYYIFAIEILHGLSSCLFDESALVHVKEISHPSILTFMSGQLNSSYDLGNLIAYIVGGELYFLLGGQKLFLISSGTCAAWSMVVLCYVIFNHLQKKKVERSRRTTLFEHALVTDITGSYANHITEPISQD